MKVRLDQITLGASGVIFVLVWLWAFVLIPGEPDSSALPQVRGSDYKPLSLPPVTREIAAWEPPAPQSEDGKWIYDVFTPPKIYINPETNLFSVIPYTGPAAKEAFGIRLLSFQRPLYRIQFEGYIEEDPDDPRKSLLRIYNRESNRLELVKVGHVSVAGQYRILDFQITRKLDDSGLLMREDLLILEDTRSGSEIRLKSGQPRYSDRFTLVFEGTSGEGESRRFQVEAEGDSFEHDGATYTIVNIDLARGRVRIEKLNEHDSAVISNIFVIPEITARKKEPSTGPASLLFAHTPTL